METDRRDPNPMRDPADIAVYDNKIQEQRLYQLLMATDERFEAIKRDILKKDPLSSPEAAYAAIRREEAHMHIIRGVPSELQTHHKEI